MSKSKSTLIPEKLKILKTVNKLNKLDIRPDKARIFHESDEFDQTRRYEYYEYVDELIADGLLEQHIETYGSAARWFYHSITKAGQKEAKKA